eukprot:TRINITY_DN1458_c0_g1_i3.p1 TRINITY_DN1458_c0_g1~~TRINITY_DN1458_c0_g1_i3.p1  ORF type:complete len:430 (+),score=63.04 TRINITY_DN1458_c0_g1_i3:156-1445(+)
MSTALEQRTEDSSLLRTEMGVSSPPPERHLPLSLLILLTFTTGVSVANLYFNQPLLELIGKEFNEPPSRAGLISMLTQVGYGFGIFFVSPLGDVLPRRPMIIILCACSAVTLVAVAFSFNLICMTVGSFLLGISNVIPQIIIPLANDLCSPNERGKTIGVVMGGLFFGILTSRIISGFVGNWLGWRYIFFIGSGVMVVLGALLFFLLPNIETKTDETGEKRGIVKYFKLLGSMIILVKDHPTLRQCAMIGFGCFAGFSVLWTTLSFRLSIEPFNYNSANIGLFGLIGLAGVIVSPIAGLLTKRIGPYFVTGISIVSVIGSWFVILFAQNSLVGIVCSIFLMDLGTQAVQVCNQTRYLILVDNAKARLNCVYIGTCFIGGALGSSLGSWAFNKWDWKGSCTVAFIFVGIGTVSYLLKRGDTKDSEYTRLK